MPPPPPERPGQGQGQGQGDEPADAVPAPRASRPGGAEADAGGGSGADAGGGAGAGGGSEAGGGAGAGTASGVAVAKGAAPDPDAALIPVQAAGASAAGRAGTPGAHTGRPQARTGAPTHVRVPPQPPRRGPSPIRPRPPAPVPTGALVAVLATGLLSALLLGDGGIGLNLLIVAVPAALAAGFAAVAAGRRIRPWTVVWALGGLALLTVPALRDAGWPTFLALAAAFGLGALALHGSRSWRGIVLAPLGLFDSLPAGIVWGWQGVRKRAAARGSLGPVLRTTGVALALLVVFGALFAGADAAFAGLVGSLVPDVSVTEGPWRVLLFVWGLIGALCAARTAAAPLRWDLLPASPGRPRSRLEWAFPLIVLTVLFAVFNAVQLAVLLRGYDRVLSETGLTNAEYARQGFWQLLWATLLTVVVIALAVRWAPRGGARDRTLVRAVLGTLCLMTLVVVASALRRMDLYVDAYGLTRLRVSVAAVELWLGVVLVLVMAAGALGARRLPLPRAVAVSAAVFVLGFGLISPDALVAERNVQRYERSGTIDIGYLDSLSADAAPALDRLPEPLRSCALRNIERDLDAADTPWYALSLGEHRAREIIEARPVTTAGYECTPGRDGDRDEFDEYGDWEPDTGGGGADPFGEYGR
ncbi:DUF4153 domain-containing protein [Streptomyces lichenis]|uniref:DUF4153 domain-containing protein n=1 Tax=Streptomyces lichenis TaxID=2306967 RepID=UPI003FD82745